MERIFKIGSILVDTGILYALSDKKDKWHMRAVRFVTSFKGRLIVPSTVVPETCYLLTTYLGQNAEIGFVTALVNREMLIEHFTMHDLVRTAELLAQYDDAAIGFVDASVVAIAERLRISTILTTDRRHFSILKPLHWKHFTLVP